MQRWSRSAGLRRLFLLSDEFPPGMGGAACLLRQANDFGPYAARRGACDPRMVDPPRLIELQRDACMSLLATAHVGRIGLTMQALPVVLPVNFVIVDGDIVFRTVNGTKFHAAAAGSVVAFEADGYESSGRSGWSVLVQGRSEVITDPAMLARLTQLTIDPWAVDGSADRFVMISTTKVTGRRFYR